MSQLVKYIHSVQLGFLSPYRERKCAEESEHILDSHSEQRVGFLLPFLLAELHVQELNQGLLTTSQVSFYLPSFCKSTQLQNPQDSGQCKK